MSYGTMVIAGKVFPIDELELRNGALRLTFAVYGPQEPFDGEFTVFGQDGKGCWQGSRAVLAHSIPDGETHVVYYEMRPVTITSDQNVTYL